MSLHHPALIQSFLLSQQNLTFLLEVLGLFCVAAAVGIHGTSHRRLFYHNRRVRERMSWPCVPARGEFMHMRSDQEDGAGSHRD